MTFKVLGSGSSGNCYLLEHNGDVLILDCGIPVKDIKIGLNFNISNVVGCAITHSHADHNKSVEDLKKMGIRTVEFYQIEDWSDDKYKHFCVGFGNFVIKPFPLPHNGTLNYGFLITDRERKEKALYLTDFEYCKYNFKSLGVNHIFIECNYQQDLVARDLPNYEHKIRGHCSLDTCKGFIQANVTNNLKTVVLLHMGTETTVPEECVTAIKKVVKSNVYVDYAYKGLEIELKTEECPF